MRKWIAFLLMAVGLGIAFFSSDMSWINRLLALCMIGGFGVFLWNTSTLKKVVEETKEEFHKDVNYVKEEVSEEIDELKEKLKHTEQR